MKRMGIIIGIFITITLLVILIPSLNGDFIKNSNLYISEVMASNNHTIEDDYGEYSDYIEIYNGYNYDLNLENYYLSDSEFETKKWSFPKIVIKAQEYLLIYASSKDICNMDTRVCHTNFKLSSKGEVVTLSDNNGNIISKMKYPCLNNDTSYGYSKNKYIITETPTPGFINSNEEMLTSSIRDYHLHITEYMTHNKGSVYDQYGNCYDWVEIYNASKDKVLLHNLYLTDEESNLSKYKIPNVEIGGEEYLIIYFSGQDIVYNDVIYANFKLSDKDIGIIISNGHDILDKVDIVPLDDNVSYGLVNNEWKYFFLSTPGFANNTASFSSMGGHDGSS